MAIGAGDSQAAILALEGRLQVMEGEMSRISDELASVTSGLEGVSTAVDDLAAHIEDIAEMAATGGGRSRGKKGRPPTVPQFKYWSGKKRSIRITPIRRLMRFRKSPTQWLRWGSVSSLQFLGAPAIIVSGVSMLITAVWSIHREIEMIKKRRKRMKAEIIRELMREWTSRMEALEEHVNRLEVLREMYKGVSP